MMTDTQAALLVSALFLAIFVGSVYAAAVFIFGGANPFVWVFF